MNRREAIVTAAAGLLGTLVPWPVSRSRPIRYMCKYMYRGRMRYLTGGKQIHWKVKYREK